MKVKQIQILPTKAQIRLIDEQIEEHRNLYNSCLAIKIGAYQFDKTSISAFDLIKSEIPPLKANGAKSNYSSLQQTLRRLQKTYSAFFKRGFGFPRFKNRDRFKSIEFSAYGDGYKVRRNKLYIFNVGEIKCMHHDFPEKIKRMTLSRKAGQYYASFTYEEEKTAKVERTDKAVGIDFGLKTFLATSDGELIDSPKFHKISLREESKVHRRIHRAELGSKERRKHKKSLAKIRRKIANRRKNFNHQVSRQLVNRYDILVVEDMNLNDLLTDIKNVNRTYRDVAFGQFRLFLSYKAESAGKRFIKVDPYNTTQECSCCGRLVYKTLDDRIHDCPCGHVEDRDINAAKNILRRGLSSLAKA